MTIIPTKLQLMPFFNDVFLEKTARRCGFMERLRNIGPQSLVLSLIAALSKGNCTSIADLHRQFNGMCLSEKHTVAYKPFHNQLRSNGFSICAGILCVNRRSKSDTCCSGYLC